MARPAGGCPLHPEMWGWQEAGEKMLAKGDRIGWLDDEDLFLDPEASYKAVQQYARAAGEPLPVTSQTLRRRLFEKGLLLSVDRRRNRFVVRRTIKGERRAVLHLHRDSVVQERSSGQDFIGRIADPSSPEAEDYLRKLKSKEAVERIRKSSKSKPDPDPEKDLS